MYFQLKFSKLNDEEKEKFLAKYRELSKKNYWRKKAMKKENNQALETQSDGLKDNSSLNAPEPHHVSSDDLSNSNGQVDIINHFSSENEWLPEIPSLNEYSEMNGVNDVTPHQVAPVQNPSTDVASVPKNVRRTIPPQRPPSPDVKIKFEFSSEDESN